MAIACSFSYSSWGSQGKNTEVACIPFSSPECPLEGLMLKLKLQYLATWFKELTHWKRPWCWKRLKAGEGDDRGWDGWMASPTQWTWVWASSGNWWWTGKSGMLQSMGSQSRTWRSDWTELNCMFQASQVALVVNNPPANAGDERDTGLIPGLGRSPGIGNGKPLQNSCLENPMDRGGWRAAVHGVTKRWTRWVTEHTCAACPALMSRFQYFLSRKAFFQTPLSNLLPLQEKAFSPPFPQNPLHSHPFKEGHCQ